MKTFIYLCLLINFFALMASANNKDKLVSEGYFVHQPELMRQLNQISALTVDHVTSDGFELWGPKGLGNWLQRNQIQATPLRPPSLAQIGAYPSPEEVAQELAAIAKAFPQISKLSSIGKSEKNRDLWVMKITADADKSQDDRPKFKFIANMHGDEIVGRELMILLIKDLVSQYQKDPLITDLLNKTQIFILPSMNPDGAAAATRGNGKFIDLNRNFPDFSTSDNKNTPEGRAPETQAVMRWQAENQFPLSANFHGGAECVNYLWDTVKDRHPKDTLLQGLAFNYAKLAPYIGASTVFKNGITNGFDWYEVNGGMQDWSTYWHGDLQFTIELSNIKWPNPNTIGYYYEQNRKALLSFISQVHNLKKF